MKKLVIAAVMFLALSAAAFAQSSFTVASTPESYVACCGLTEKTGDISFTAVPGTPDSILGTLTVTYPVPITNAATVFGGPPNSNVFAIWRVGTIGGTPGVLPPGITDGMAVTPSVANVDGKGVVVISVPAAAQAPYSIRLTGVRVNVSGACSGSIAANITSTGNLLTSGETNVTVISNVSQALRNPAYGSGGTPPVFSNAAAINAVTGVVTYANTATFGNVVLVNIQENFLDAFGKIAGAAGDTTANRAKQVRLTFSSFPAGVSVTLPATDNSTLFALTTASGGAATSFTVPSATGSLVAYYTLTTNSVPTTLESLSIPITVNVSPLASLPLASGSVNVSAHIAPIDALATAVPRYADDAACQTATLTVLTVQGASTTLLVPYAVNSAGYDTGLEVANTTTDPGTAAMGFTQAVRQAGAMTFYFYPQTGDAFSYATVAGSPGTGLAADGTLATGRIYTALLSQLLAAANKGPDFSGYIFIICNFTNGHGQYFISDFEFFTNGALMLVVNRDSVGRANPESLGN
jgi:hypothetical protein